MATKETDGAVGVDAAVLRKAIARYVTDDDENVFALVGLPEEVLAVLFAYYSRSSATLRENLALLIAEGDLDVGGEGSLDAAREKARIFHEKWTVGYGHGCYDGATEVLTEQGWMSWPQLAAIPSPPRLATLRPEDDVVEFLEPVKLVVAPYDGQMYRVRSGYVDLLVTPNHKMWVCPTTTRAGRRKEAYRLIEARELGMTSSAYQMDAVWKGESVEEITDGKHSFSAEPLMALMGFFIGDGCHDPRYHDAVTFHLKKERKIRFLTEVCGEGRFQMQRHLGNKFYVSAPGLGDLLSKCYSESGDKQIPRSVLALSSDLLERLLAGMMASDGHVDRNDSWLYSTTSTVLRDQCYELALRVGCSAYARTDTDRGENREPLHVVHFNRSRVRPVVNKLAGDNQVTWERYVGTVYCAEMPRNHTLFVRRNMRAVWCGNSVSEHAVAHVAAERVSILAAKAIEDCRLGAYTEKSTRYVRMDRSALVTDVGMSPQGLEAYTRGAYRLLDVYQELVEEVSAEMGRRHPEIDARTRAARCFDMLRGLLPAGVGTNVGITANGRVLTGMVSKLAGSELPECHRIADRFRDHGGRVMPTFLRHSGPSSHRMGALARVMDALGDRPDPAAVLLRERGSFGPKGHAVKLQSQSGTSIRSLARAVLRDVGYVGIFTGSLVGLSDEKSLAAVNAYLDDRGEREAPLRALETARYRYEVTCDYGAWRDLQRHRRVSATTPILSARADFAVPADLDEYGVTERFVAAIHESALAYEAVLDADGPYLAQYVVSLARHVTWSTDVDLRELFHIIGLRSGKAGHPSYRGVAIDLADQLIALSPYLEPHLRVERGGAVWAREGSKHATRALS
jgi:thymidylate synthase ThyX